MGGIFKYVSPSPGTPPVWSATSISLPHNSSFDLTTICNGISYTSGTLPTGVTLAGTILSANATATVGAANVSFVATGSGGSTTQIIALTVSLVPMSLNSPAAITLTQGGSVNLDTYRSGGVPSFSYAQSAGQTFSLGGLTLSSAGVLTAASNAIVQTTGGYRVAVTDAQLLNAQSTTFSVQVLSFSSQTITLPAGEMFAFWKLPQFLAINPAWGGTGGYTNFQVRANAGDGTLPPGSYLGTGSEHNNWAGVFFAFAPLSNTESLCTQGTFQNIFIRANTSSGPVDAGPFTIVVQPPLAKGFTLVRGGNTFATYYKLCTPFNAQTFQDGDILQVTAGRNFYDPSGGMYTTGTNGINASITIRSSTPTVGSALGQRSTLDISDSVQHDAFGLISVNTFKFANKANCTVSVSDLNLIGIYNDNENATAACVTTKGPSDAVGPTPLHLTLTNMSFSGCNTGVSADGPAVGTLSYATDTSTLDMNYCEAFNLGSASGPSHSWYVSHLNRFTAIGCYSHSMRNAGSGNGHLGKSKAKTTNYIACRFTSENGNESFLLDNSVCGNVTLQGCIFEKNSPSVGSNVCISFGREWGNWPDTDGRGVPSVKMYQCTFAGYLNNENVLDFGSVLPPTLSFTAGGSLPQTTYYVRVTLLSPTTGESFPAGESGFTSAGTAIGSITVPANNRLVVTPSFVASNVPWTTGDATGWNIYASSSAGTETLQASGLTLGSAWTMPLTGLVSGAALVTSGARKPLPGLTIDIQDNVFAGPNCPAADGTLTFAQQGGVQAGAQYRLVGIPSKNTVGPALSSGFNTFFSNAANYDFSLITTVAATGTETPATLAYSYPVGTVARTDFSRGAYIAGLPFWATQSALPPGTWATVGLNTLNDGTCLPTVKWGVNNFNWGGILTQWGGGCYASDYSQFGGVACFGNGHALNVDTYLNNGVVVWNGATAKWEGAVQPWYDPTKIFAPSIIPNSEGTATSGVTLAWGSGAGTGPPGGLAWFNSTLNINNCQQHDSELASRGEYVPGVRAADHTYFNITYIPAIFGGGTKGSLWVYGSRSSGVGNAGGPSLYPSDINLANQFTHAADLSAGTWGRYCLPGTSATGTTSPNEVARGAVNSIAGGGTSCFDTRRGKIYHLGQNLVFSPTPTDPLFRSAVNVYNTAPADPNKAALLCGFSSSAQRNNDRLDGALGGWVFIPHPTDPSQDIVVNGLHTNGTGISVAWANWVATLGTGQGFDATVGFWNGVISNQPPGPFGVVQGATFANLRADLHGFMYCPDLGPNGSIVMCTAVTDRSNWWVYKLAVPSDRRNGTWVWSWENLNLAGSVPAAPNNPADWEAGDPNAGGIYNKMCYMPKAKCFWIVDLESMKPRAFRPTGII